MFANFGGAMKAAPMQVLPFTGERVREVLRAMPHTSACLDLCTADELQELEAWRPGLFEALPTIMNLIEETGAWPQAMVRGYVAHIPKDPSVTERSVWQRQKTQEYEINTRASKN